jgi:hypothetical protein
MNIDATDKTREAALPFLAGFVSGRGGFDEADGRVWLFLLALDHEVAADAVSRWSGWITARDHYHTGQQLFKWTVTNDHALRALSDMAPYLRGFKREKALRLLEKFEGEAA